MEMVSRKQFHDFFTRAIDLIKFLANLNNLIYAGIQMKKLLIILFILIPFILFPQEELRKDIEALKRQNEALGHRLDMIEKTIDDVLWFQRVGDVAFIDKVFMTGPPKWKEKNPDAQGAGNPVKIWSYVFIPKDWIMGRSIL
jgi:hypothetical protein